ncbi:hypothetical protein H2198_002553 [Neophaeococcomyces mojaviensis]|uniref:Uncharacterized protein n=1 Tax=Neophaeococcomyces mojaviensis TaxID=3383035 RepID=A0ACC3ADV0_9EURO|nr:hypothetical protein H2198_002553 [Knufia sp. JES_112]
MGIAIPASLTDGAFGALVVKSQSLNSCVTSEVALGWLRYAMALPKIDAISQQCFGEAIQTCDSQYYFTSPHIVKRRIDSCPFPSNVCQKGIKPFEILHMNASAFDFGINSPSKISFSHRLTCAPLNVDDFLLVPTLHPNHSWISARTTLDRKTAWSNFSVLLSTVNGPNSFSNESSGRKMAIDNGPAEVTVLPRHIVPFSVNELEYQKLIHQDLRRDDGQSFMIVNRAGRTIYSSEVNDPFLSAHNKVNHGEDYVRYLPDYEATALGCVEQYQFCVPRSSRSTYCSQWGFTTQAWADIQEVLVPDETAPLEDLYDIMERIASFDELIRSTTVYGHLALRNTMHDLTRLLRDQSSNNRFNELESEPWTLEVETWFMKAILNAIFRIRMGAKYRVSSWRQFEESDPEFERYISQRWSTCGRVLFRDPDYVNINWIGFCSTFGVLCLITVVSYLVERLQKCGQVVTKLIANPHDTVAMVHFILGPLVTRLHQETRVKIRTTVDSIHRSWRRIWSNRKSLGRGRVWYRSRRRNKLASGGVLRGNVYRPPARSDGNNPYDCYLEDLPSARQ